MKEARLDTTRKRDRDPRKVRVHVQRAAAGHGFFDISEQDFAAALGNHADIAAAIEVTFGSAPADLDRKARQTEVLLTGNLQPCDLGSLLPNLRWVQSIHTGVERLAPLIPPRVTLTNVAGVDARKAAEFVIGALIFLNGALPRLIAQQARACWRPIYTAPLAGKTVLILGTGSLGQAIAREARHFGMSVLGVSRSGQPRPGFAACATPIDLPRLLPQAEFLVVALPSTPETRGLVGRCELDRLPRSAGLVNIGRSDAVDYDALSAKLAAGELGGAVLDVFDTEPLPPASPLWKVPNLLITPHCAIDDAPGYVPGVLAIFLDNLGRYLAGRPLRNVVDVTLGY